MEQFNKSMRNGPLGPLVFSFAEHTVMPDSCKCNHAEGKDDLLQDSSTLYVRMPGGLTHVKMSNSGYHWLTLHSSRFQH